MSNARETAVSRLQDLAAAAGGGPLPAASDGLAAFSVPREGLLGLLAGLRDDPQLGFRLFLDVTAVDWSGCEPRFEVVYHVYSLDLRMRVRVKTRCSERDLHVPSIVSVYPGAEYFEREVFDMFGITFDGHPDLRRILLPEEYEHHPLRKDFPCEGIEPEKVYRLRGGPMMPRPAGAEAIPGAGSTTP